VQQKIVLRVVSNVDGGKLSIYYTISIIGIIILAFAGGKEGTSLSCHFGWGWAPGFTLALDLFRFFLVHVLIEVLIVYLRARCRTADWSAIQISVL